jgi:hypothetical protein
LLLLSLFFWMGIEALALVNIFHFHWTTLMSDDECGRDANMAARHLRKLRNTIFFLSFSLRNLVRFVRIKTKDLQKSLETPLLSKVSHPFFRTNLKNKKGKFPCAFLGLFVFFFYFSLIVF